MLDPTFFFHFWISAEVAKKFKYQFHMWQKQRNVFFKNSTPPNIKKISPLYQLAINIEDK